MTPDITIPITAAPTKLVQAVGVIISREGADMRVHFPVEHVYEVDGTTLTRPSNPVTRLLSDVAAETVTVDDPVTGQPATVSAAFLQLAIRELFIRWHAEDNAPAEA